MTDPVWGELITVKRVSTPKMIRALQEDRLYRRCDVGARAFEYWVPAGEWACPEVRRAEDGVRVVKFGSLTGPGYPLLPMDLRRPGVDGAVLDQPLRLLQPHRGVRKANRDIGITLAGADYEFGWRDRRATVVRPDATIVSQHRRQWRLTEGVSEVELCLAVAVALSNVENALASPILEFLP